MRLSLIFGRLLYKVILTNESIKQELAALRPKKIVVAYLGQDWREYITDVKQLELVIVSPKAGTNKDAVIELAKEIGWEKILLLENLHAKLYMGDSQAILGSANLSQNGIDEGCLVELCKSISSENDLADLNNFVDAQEKACLELEYNKDSKSKLKKLEQYDSERNRRLDRELKEFDFSTDKPFYLSWWESDNGFSDEGVEELYNKGVIDHYIEIVYEENAKETFEGSWILLWRLTQKNAVDKARKLEWLYVHEVYENADAGYDFPITLVQREDEDVPKKPPFKLDAPTQKALRTALSESEVGHHFVPLTEEDEGKLTLTESNKSLELLIKDAKKRLPK